MEYPKGINSVNGMVNCPYFKTNFLHLNKDFMFETKYRDSFTIYMCVDGEALIENEFGKVSIEKGETTLLPAITEEIAIKTTGVKLLEVTI